MSLIVSANGSEGAWRQGSEVAVVSFQTSGFGRRVLVETVQEPRSSTWVLAVVATPIIVGVATTVSGLTSGSAGKREHTQQDKIECHG